jgi:hypothetical protein
MNQYFGINLDFKGKNGFYTEGYHILFLQNHRLIIANLSSNPSIYAGGTMGLFFGFSP